MKCDLVAFIMKVSYKMIHLPLKKQIGKLNETHRTQNIKKAFFWSL